LAQQALLLVPLLSTDSLFSTPPLHGYHLGHAAFADQQQAFPFKASHTHRHPAGAIEDAFAAARQAPNSAGAHRAQSFQFLAFWFFQHATIPNAQRRFSSLFHLFSTRLRKFPQHLFDHLRCPPVMV
jgi:hypothetical protein